MVNYGKPIQAPNCSLTNWKAHCFLSPEWSALIVRWRWLQAMLDKLIFTERHHKETFYLRIPQRSVVIIKHIILHVALVKFYLKRSRCWTQGQGKSDTQGFTGTLDVKKWTVRPNEKTWYSVASLIADVFQTTFILPSTFCFCNEVGWVQKANVVF